MNDFTLAYDRFVPEEEGLREALTSTGNGYFCTRGAAEWAGVTWRSHAFWSQALTSQSAASAAGYVPPMTMP